MKQIVKRYGGRIGYPNRGLISAGLMVLFLLLGGSFGYSMALFERAEETVHAAFAAPFSATRVLGTGAGPYYANPFEVLDARAITFPLPQLAECRNWEECRAYCDEEENFQACVAWSQSLE
ncbi:MAG: hypothetical protein AAB671_00745 [Patescibacteria group bacterium]